VRDQDAGETLVQLVVLVPVLLLLVLVVVQAGLWLHAAQLADHAAADGAAAAARYGSTTGDGITAAAAFVADAGGRLAADPAVISGPATVRVAVRVHVPRVVPGWPDEVEGVADVPTERVVPETQR
jgi:Flp pilus assembly protein TadG